MIPSILAGAAVGIILVLTGYEIGIRYARAVYVKRIDRLMDQMDSINPDGFATTVLAEAAQDIDKDDSQIRNLEKLLKR